MILVLAAPPGSCFAEQPLSKDDVKLLLIGGATTQMISLIERRGVDFRMAPELSRTFRNDGASATIIQALERAGS